jgi:hypothetical protein
VNSRTPIEELKLIGSPNLKRALKREAADANKLPLSETQKSEIAQLDALIQKALHACERGQVFRGKRNPAFGNLKILMQLRKLLADTPDQKAQTSEEILAEANKLMGVN